MDWLILKGGGGGGVEKAGWDAFPRGQAGTVVFCNVSCSPAMEAFAIECFIYAINK